MKLSRWELGQIGGALILLCSFIHKKYGFAVPTAFGAVLGFIIIAICFISEIVKNIRTGEVRTLEYQKVGLHIPGFISIYRSSSPFSFYCHVAAYTILATYCSYYGFYYVYLFTK